jgi:hypothetical protein
VNINHLGLAKFCYNLTKYSTIGVNPFELELRVEAKQSMDLIIPRFGIDYCKGGKNAEALHQKCHFMTSLI